MNDDLDSRFDGELRRAARALVSEQLPHGVLDAGLAPGGAHGQVQSRRSVSVLAGYAVAVVLVLAAAIAIIPGGGRPSSSPTPAATPTPTPAATRYAAFKKTLDIRGTLMFIKYSCKAGGPLSTFDPGPSAMVREGAICTAPAADGPFIAAVIVGEAADGSVVEVHVKADLTEADTPEARAAIAEPMAKVAAISVDDETIGDALAQWILTTVPTIEPSKGAGTEIGGISLKLIRAATGGYQLLVHRV